jgi:hypothetical protein
MLGGIVYDLSIDRDAGIENAVVTYRQQSSHGAGAHGTTRSSIGGHYAFEVELHNTDGITVAVEAAAFNSAGLRFSGSYANQSATRLDVGLEPATRSQAAPACGGDCGRIGSVTVVDLVTLISVSLGSPVERCDPGDVNRDGSVTVDEVTLAVGNALGGCRLELPDLLVAEVNTGGLQDCHSATMLVCVRNDGAATDRTFSVDVGRGSSDYFDVHGIGAGEVRCFERPFEAGATIDVDPTGGVDEIDEDNNAFSTSGVTLQCLPTRTATLSPTPTGSYVTASPTPTRPTATPTPSMLPNLVVHSVTADRWVSTHACIFDVPSYPRLEICVRNAGNRRAGAFSISLDGEDILRTDDLPAQYFFCDSVAFQTEGRVVADSLNEIEEGSEEDNAAEFSLVRPTPPETCTPIRTPTPTATERRYTCCQRVSDCYRPEPVGHCFADGVGYESPAFCNGETGECESIPPTRTPTPTRNPTQPAPDLEPLYAELYAPLLMSCGRNNPIAGRYCVTNRGGDASTTVVLRLNSDGFERDFASFAGIRGGEVLCVIGPHERGGELAVDPYDSIAEVNESNNSLSFSLPIPTYPPDCTATPTPEATATP